MPSVSSSNVITGTAQIGDKVIVAADIADDTITAAQIAANAIGDSEVAAHTTTKITSPFSLVTGTVPITQGGTGQTTATAAFDALDPLTTQGDIAYHNGTNTVRLGTGTNGQALLSGGAGANLSWGAPSGTPNWVDEGTLTWASSTADQTLNLTNTTKDLYMLVVNFGSTTASAISMQINGVTGTSYNVAIVQHITFTYSAATSSMTLTNGAHRGCSGVVYISRGITSGDFSFQGSTAGGNTSFIFNGEETTQGGAAFSSIKFLVNGATITGKAHMYSLNL